MYIGRFAPSPTGPLHFGSLIAAVASYCDAKANGGKWLVRMEDLDKPREVKGAAADILRTLETFGFAWDGAIVYQSERQAIYQAALDVLAQQALIYPCTCTRKEIADSSHVRGIDGVIYPQTCLFHAPKPHAAQAWRIKTNAQAIIFEDAIQGKITQVLNQEVGDFILKRADGLFAYQLAVVVDDALQNVTHIVRGADLLDSTPRQIYLQRCLGYPTPHYAHVPVATNIAGEKLSKQTLAKPILPAFSAPLAQRESYISLLLWQALTFLGQSPSDEMKNAKLAEVWRWALQHWEIQKIPKTLHMMPPD